MACGCGEGQGGSRQADMRGGKSEVSGRQSGRGVKTEGALTGKGSDCVGNPSSILPLLTLPLPSQPRVSPLPPPFISLPLLLLPPPCTHPKQADTLSTRYVWGSGLPTPQLNKQRPYQRDVWGKRSSTPSFHVLPALLHDPPAPHLYISIDPLHSPPQVESLSTRNVWGGVSLLITAPPLHLIPLPLPLLQQTR